MILKDIETQSRGDRIMQDKTTEIFRDDQRIAFICQADIFEAGITLGGLFKNITLFFQYFELYILVAPLCSMLQLS